MSLRDQMASNTFIFLVFIFIKVIGSTFSISQILATWSPVLLELRLVAASRVFIILGRRPVLGWRQIFLDPQMHIFLLKGANATSP